MRTYERRVSRDGRREGMLERLGSGKFEVSLTRHGRRSTATAQHYAHSLTAARGLVREWLNPAKPA